MFGKISNLSHIYQVNYRPQVPQIFSDVFRSIDNITYETYMSSFESDIMNESNNNIISTINDYLKLDLNPKDANFWSTNLDRRYQETLIKSDNSKKKQRHFPLKVRLAFLHLCFDFQYQFQVDGDLICNTYI